MVRYLLRRLWGAVTEDEMMESGLRSVQVAAELPDVDWIHSHIVSDDQGRIVSYCIYEASSSDSVLDHAGRTGGHFVDRVVGLDDDVVADEDASVAQPADRRWVIVQRWPGADRQRTADTVRAVAADDALVTWEHTHIGTDVDGRVVTHGVFGAGDETSARKHAEQAREAELVELFEIAGDVTPADLAV